MRALEGDKRVWLLNIWFAAWKYQKKKKKTEFPNINFALGTNVFWLSRHEAVICGSSVGFLLKNNKPVNSSCSIPLWYGLKKKKKQHETDRKQTFSFKATLSGFGFDPTQRKIRHVRLWSSCSTASTKLNMACLSISPVLPPTSVHSLSTLIIPDILASILGLRLSGEGDTMCSDSFHGLLSHLSSPAALSSYSHGQTPRVSSEGQP